MGAPGVGALVTICAPRECALAKALLKVMPLPETRASAACAFLSGAFSVMEAPEPPPPPKPRRPRFTDATIAVSRFAPLPIVMLWPGPKPIALATGRAVAPALVSLRTVVPPAVPTVAMEAVSRFSLKSIITIWPAERSATLATLILFVPAAESAARVIAVCTRKSRQLLPVSAPSGNRPALLIGAFPEPSRPKGPLGALGEGTLQPLPGDSPWYPSAAQGSTRPP